MRASSSAKPLKASEEALPEDTLTTSSRELAGGEEEGEGGVGEGYENEDKDEDGDGDILTSESQERSPIAGARD